MAPQDPLQQTDFRRSDDPSSHVEAEHSGSERDNGNKGLRDTGRRKAVETTARVISTDVMLTRCRRIQLLADASLVVANDSVDAPAAEYAGPPSVGRRRGISYSPFLISELGAIGWTRDGRGKNKKIGTNTSYSPADKHHRPTDDCINKPNKGGILRVKDLEDDAVTGDQSNSRTPRNHRRWSPRESNKPS
ncbi:unnamed protein product, partial [Iphiclides podalirius]